VLYFAFWLWMVWHCLRTEPDRFLWLWVLFVVQGVGPVLYFFLRYLPSTDLRPPSFFRRWTRGRELARLETAAVQIGNPHQYIQWGDLLREVGRYEEAGNAYDRALKKDALNLQALWGAAQVATVRKLHERTRDLTRQILDKDPQYKFGDVSLAHGKALIELGERDAAAAHFEQHVRRWRHPEAVYLLASLCAERGNRQAARDHLQSVLHDINGSPAAIARKHGRWKSRAKQLLRKLPIA
ncbi:MAG: tetratricopeptide repeat protein, partial [Candidatus Saccharimonas sp.]|nr:tetratricopeptide repeat protein [Planctomycetaceae bacterium]